MDRRDVLQLIALSEAIASEAVQGEVFPNQDVTTKLPFDPDLSSECPSACILVACGSAGIEMTRGINKSTYGIDRIVAIDINRASVLSITHCDFTYWIGRQDGTDVTTADEALQAAVEREDEIRCLIGTPQVAIIVTGLGGAGDIVLPQFAAKCANEAGAITMAFATFPPADNDSDTSKLALAAHERLNQSVNNLLVYDRLLVDRFPPAEGLRQYLWNTVACHTRYGMVGIDVEDVRTVLRPNSEGSAWEGLNSRTTSRLGWASAIGPDRARRAVTDALQHPLLGADRLGPPSGIVVSIRASTNTLRMREVSTIMCEIDAHCGTDTLIVFSADFDDTLEDRLQVSLVLQPRGDNG